MNDDTRSEAIRSAFNDAAREGYPVALSSRSEPIEDVVPVVLLMANGVGGMYHRVYDPRTEHQFVPGRFTGILPIPRVADVELLDQSGKPCIYAPGDLSTCTLRFTVRGNVKGDLYRVEIFPDPTAAVQEIEQIVAGKHVSAIQRFDVPLRRIARAEVQLSIYRVDEATAKRDMNDEAALEWQQTYRILT